MAALPRLAALLGRGQWSPNGPACALCGRGFSMAFNRPHHCRGCGSCACNDCAPQREVLLETSASVVRVRCCDACAGVAAHDKARNRPAELAVGGLRGSRASGSAGSLLLHRAKSESDPSPMLGPSASAGALCVVPELCGPDPHSSLGDDAALGLSLAATQGPDTGVPDEFTLAAALRMMGAPTAVTQQQHRPGGWRAHASSGGDPQHVPMPFQQGGVGIATRAGSTGSAGLDAASAASCVAAPRSSGGSSLAPRGHLPSAGSVCTGQSGMEQPALLRSALAVRGDGAELGGISQWPGEHAVGTGPGRARGQGVGPPLAMAPPRIMVPLLSESSKRQAAGVQRSNSDAARSRSTVTAPDAEAGMSSGDPLSPRAAPAAGAGPAARGVERRHLSTGTAGPADAADDLSTPIAHLHSARASQGSLRAATSGSLDGDAGSGTDSPDRPYPRHSVGSATGALSARPPLYGRRGSAEGFGACAAPAPPVYRGAPSAAPWASQVLLAAQPAVAPTPSTSAVVAAAAAVPPGDATQPHGPLQTDAARAGWAPLILATGAGGAATDDAAQPASPPRAGAHAPMFFAPASAAAAASAVAAGAPRAAAPPPLPSPAHPQQSQQRFAPVAAAAAAAGVARAPPPIGIGGYSGPPPPPPPPPLRVPAGWSQSHLTAGGFSPLAAAGGGGYGAAPSYWHQQQPQQAFGYGQPPAYGGYGGYYSPVAASAASRVATPAAWRGASAASSAAPSPRRAVTSGALAGFGSVGATYPAPLVWDAPGGEAGSGLPRLRTPGGPRVNTSASYAAASAGASPGGTSPGSASGSPTFDSGAMTPSASGAIRYCRNCGQPFFEAKRERQVEADAPGTYDALSLEAASCSRDCFATLCVTSGIAVNITGRGAATPAHM